MSLGKTGDVDVTEKNNRLFVAAVLYRFDNVEVSEKLLSRYCGAILRRFVALRNAYQDISAVKYLWFESWSTLIEFWFDEKNLPRKIKTSLRRSLQ